MIVQTVGFRRLETTGNYNNVAFEATAQLEVGESPEQAMDAVREFVNGQVEQLLDNERRAQKTESDIRSAEYKLEKLESQVRTAQSRYQQAREFLSKHNVPLPEMPAYYRGFEADDEDPFTRE